MVTQCRHEHWENVVVKENRLAKGDLIVGWVCRDCGDIDRDFNRLRKEQNNAEGTTTPPPGC